jgi:CxxC motif-containing protein
VKAMPDSETKVITCIGCPSGCEITVTKIGDNFTVEGNECNRGEDYAIEEFTAPKRILTTTLQVKNGILPLIPVRSDSPLPKDKLFDCMDHLCKVQIPAPIKMGDILVKDILNLGSNIIASRDLEKK